MSQLDPFTRLPEHVSQCVLSQWLEPRDLARLDSSYCSWATRSKFLALVGGPGIIYSGLPVVPHNRWNTYIAWLNKKGIRVASLLVPREMTAQPDIFKSQGEAFFRMCGSSLREINVQGSMNGPAQQYACFVDLISLCPNLAELTFPSNFAYTVPILQQVATLCPALQVLTMHDAQAGQGFESLRNVEFSYPDVREISLKYGKIDTDCLCGLVSVTPHVDKLTMHNTMLLPDFVLPSNANMWNNLTSLILCDAVLTDRVVSSFLPHFPLLTHLHLQCAYYSLTDVTMTCIAENCLLLTEIRVRSEGISDEGVCRVLQHCTQLTNVNLDYCKSLTNNTLFAIAKYGKNIHTLSIFECRKLSELGLTEVAVECVFLRHLTLTPPKISWYSKISDNLLELFAERDCEVVQDRFY